MRGAATLGRGQDCTLWALGVACWLLQPNVRRMDNDWMQAPSTAERGYLGSDERRNKKKIQYKCPKRKHSEESRME